MDLSLRSPLFSLPVCQGYDDFRKTWGSGGEPLGLVAAFHLLVQDGGG